MSYARAERRRAADPRQRSRPWEPPAINHRVVGVLDDDRPWTINFPTAAHARRFLEILGEPPATERRLRAAMRVLKRELPGA
jgi:hypothetical protein